MLNIFTFTRAIEGIYVWTKRSAASIFNDYGHNDLKVGEYLIEFNCIVTWY